MNSEKREQIKILLAEDDADDREFFHEAVLSSHAHVQFAIVSDGKFLIKYLSSCKRDDIDILFLDINMPYMNGIECLRAIRNNETFRDLPVIMLSTSSFPSDINQTFKDGANMYVSKPAFFNDEINILKNIFEMYYNGELLIPDRKKYFLKPSGFSVM